MTVQRTQARARGNVSTLMATAAFSVILVAEPALAQAADEAPDAPQEEEALVVKKVVVTGTSVRGQAPVGSTVDVIDEKLLLESGQANTTDLLRTIPAMTNLGIDEGRGGGVQGAQGNVSQAKTLNMRGLGAESTLVLLNGRRIGQTGTQAEGYDVSQFATRSIQRVEVVADGASAIYGSDAVGGVVNFITKRDYDGIEVFGRHGFADGFDETRFGFAAGKTWNTGDVFFTYEHYDRGGLLGSDREELTQDLRPYGGPDLRTNFASPGTIIVGTTPYAVPRGTDGTSLEPGDFIPNTSNRTDINDYRSLLTDTAQDNYFLSIHQDVTDTIEVWAEAMYSNRAYEGFGRSLSTGAPTATLVVPNTNPFFVHPTNPAATSVSVRYDFGETFESGTKGGESPMQVAAGFEWEVTDDWVVEGYASYGENTAFRKARQLWSFNLPAVLADPNPATAFNPFCDTAVFSCHNPATVALLDGYNIIKGELEYQDTVIKASGPVFTLPGGEVSVAVGAEYYDTDLLTTITTLTTTALPAPRVTESNRDVTSLFAEVFVPLVGPDNAMPGVQSLDVVAAIRQEEYSDFGKTTNPKFGVNWEPFETLKLRGTYGKSFRAPSLGDIDADATRTYAVSILFDPTISQNITTLQLIGAGEDLGPEEADTWTIGFDWKPISGLNTSLTYYNIDYKNRISTVSPSQILANPSVFGDRITPNPDAALVQSYYNSVYFQGAQVNPALIQAIINSQSGNLNSETQKGIDGTISYDFDAIGSQWTVGASFTKILEAEQEQLNGLVSIDALDRLDYPVDLRARAFGTWQYDLVRVAGFVNYVDGYLNDQVTPNQMVESWITLDMTASIEAPEDAPGWLKGTRFAISATNLTDEDPPFVLNTTSAVSGIYDSQNASAIGRLVSFEISKKW